MKLNKILIVAVLSLGLNMGNAMAAINKDTIKAVKTIVTPALLTTIGIPGEVADYLLLGMDMADFGLSFQDNVTEVKNSIGAAAKSFKEGLAKLKILRDQLNAAPDSLAKQALIPQINELVVTMVDKFEDFMTIGGLKFIIPLMRVAEKIPGIGPQMKTVITEGKEPQPFSTFMSANLGGFKDAMDLEVEFIPVIKELVEKKIASDRAAQAAGQTVAPVASLDDI